MVYVPPNQDGSKVKFRSKYDHFIGGQWVAPKKGQYFDNVSPVTGQPFVQIARGTSEDVEAALDAAHAAKTKWAKTSVADRAAVLNKIADRMEQNLEMLAVAETWDNGKPVRETLAADMPLGLVVTYDTDRNFGSEAVAQGDGPPLGRELEIADLLRFIKSAGIHL